MVAKVTSAPRELNRMVLRFFGPVLILVGVLGFVCPPELALTSGAAPYNVFHIVFGALGVFLAARGERASALFNLGFGAVDLYQAVASRAGLFPKAHFQWRLADDVLHVVIGAALVWAGASALCRPAAPRA